ncbi:hypothetical protein VPMG_00017 [Vibrio phage VBP32]|uniref:Uncharacterized protein n=2 Tax=Stoningtonvirus VBP47 TaxID=2846606 RepID=M4SPB3_9CAUD|nr:hypothetical protein VPNG_00111 [Vibrio phage VBP47]YP_007676507.1 hypothetical protein VPMG_00017 [Vibrio phage VBP32]AGH57135.1 hypothetical protein VPNG_00111 [Vibrio phage VBP47]AGH57156.1 hypothetical protein VPMG_00017 [Vibrio phage VBP32]
MAKIKVYRGYLASGKPLKKMFAVVEGRERYIALRLDGDWDMHREFYYDSSYGVRREQVTLQDEVQFECDNMDELVNHGKTLRLLGVLDE